MQILTIYMDKQIFTSGLQLLPWLGKESPFKAYNPMTGPKAWIPEIRWSLCVTDNGPWCSSSQYLRQAFQSKLTFPAQ